MKKCIADLHCDLLCYLQGCERRSAYDKAVRCSIPQLRKGNVLLQALPIFTETRPGSSVDGWEQVMVFKTLPQKYPDTFEIVNRPHHLQDRTRQDRIGIMLAVENASSLCSEEEPLDLLFQRIEIVEQKIAKIIYLSFTWNQENRFGGGAHSQVGLKSDGKSLLDFLNKRKIALDISHASDQLVHDTLLYTTQHSLDIPIIASHSNMRPIANVPRNLPDELAIEVLNRKGVIGLNFVRDFVGAETTKNFAHQLSHALKLGAHQHLCFGADFFFGEDVSPEYRRDPHELFFPGYDHAGAYHDVIEIWHEHHELTQEFIDGVSYRNLKDFLERSIFVDH